MIRGTRRSMIGGMGGLFAASATPRAFAQSNVKKRILILGGTNFVGPHLVHGAQIAGHDVTLFNRGMTNPHLFPEVEKIRGDRTTQDGLARLHGDREWDMVIDTWHRHPIAVRNTARLLSGRAMSYVYISSIAVYSGFRKLGLTEEDPILPIGDAPSFDAEDIGYSWAKRMGEEAATVDFDGPSAIVRGSGIFGYDYSTSLENQNSYWVLRIRAGGEVMAPGSGADRVQWSDVAALADFAISLGEKRKEGSFNALLPPTTFREYLESIRRHANPDARLTWVPQELVMENGGTPFEVVPFWIPNDDSEPGFYAFDPSKALFAGMRKSTLDYAIKHQLKSFARLPRDFQPNWASSGGVPAEVEQRILQAYKRQKRAGAG